MLYDKKLPSLADKITADAKAEAKKAKKETKSGSGRPASKKDKLKKYEKKK